MQKKTPKQSNYDIQDKDKQQHQHHQLHNQLPFSAYYNVNIRFDPISPEAGKPTELMLSVTDQRLGDPIKEFEPVHDKLVHVIIVGEIFLTLHIFILR